MIPVPRTRAYHPCLLRSTLAACLLIAAVSGCDRGSHPTQVGTPAPDFSVHYGSQTVSLDQYRGKILVLNFWASWCAPCLEEFPSLIQLQREMPNIAVVAISFDEDPAAYRQYLIDNHLGGITITYDQSQRSNLAFGTTRPPETYIIDQHGQIRRKFIGAQDWTSPEITEYLQKLS